MTETKRAIEAVLMAAIEPIEPQLLAQLTETPVDDIEAFCVELREEYERDGRGFTLVKVAGGFRYQTAADMAPYVERFVLDGQRTRLTRAALETLAVVAYRQPVSRARVSAVRGVNVDGVMRTLVARGLVEEASHDGESGSILYRTTSYFLERLGLRGVDELPELAPFLPELDTLDDADSGDSVPAHAGPADSPAEQ